MGMSATQARLLSITSRLTNNEFRSQTITNSKLRLATESQEASQAYMDALDSKQIMFMNYDDNGEASKTPLTAAVLYDYAPMKNQYMITNTSGKYLVSNKDAENFQNSENLFDFLDKYDLAYDVTYSSKKQEYSKWKEDCKTLTDKYNNETLPQWEAECETLTDKYNNETLPQWKADCEEKIEKYDAEMDNWNLACQKIDEEYEEYLNNFNATTTADNTLYDNFVSIVGTSKVLEKYSDMPETAEYCYYNGLNGDEGCYLHLLNHLLDFYNYDSAGSNDFWYNAFKHTNTIGNVFTYLCESGGMDNHITDKQYELFKQISLAINAENPSLMCDGSDKFTPYYNNDGTNDKLEWTASDNIIQQAITAGREPTKFEQLKSDYKYVKNADGSNPRSELKTLKEKLVDLYYLILCSSNLIKNDNDLNHDDIKRDMKELLINFTEGDLKTISKGTPEPKRPYDDMPTLELDPEPKLILPNKPELVLPDRPEYEEGVMILRDQEKSQWYTNLWHAMNGSENANVVDPINFDSDVDYIKNIPEDIRSEYRFIVENSTKDIHHTNYEVIDLNLNDSAEWLEFALEHGAVTLQQTKYYNPAEDNNKTANLSADGYYWENIVYTSARDFVTIDDEKAIAIAEVKYKKAITEIENKDKKFDQDLKKLDTEHNALQTEYESMKEVLSKNVQRSFKAFS